MNRTTIALAPLFIVDQMAEEPSAPPPEPMPTPPEAIEWMRANAVPLATAEPGSGFDDLRPLANRLGGARIVSLGEATHGTREFFLLKHRLFEWLVAEHGFTTYGFEATFPESLDVDRYVCTGQGSAADALAGMRFWTWDTEEVLDLIEWMRTANEARAADDPLHFYGYDMQMPGAALLGVIEYLQAVDPALAVRAAAEFDAVKSDGGLAIFGNRPVEERQAVADRAAALLGTFDEQRASWTAKTGERAWQLARLHAAVVTQGLTIFAEPPAVDARDKGMAENVAALLGIEGTGRMVSWAHNGHAQKIGFAENMPSMGQCLDERYGKDHVVVGFAFGEGSFQAIRMPGGGLHDHTVGSPVEHSLDAALAAVGLPIFALDLRSSPKEGPVHEWLATGPLSRSIGSVYGEEYADSFWCDHDPRRAFDVLVFVARTTAARRNPSGQRLPTPVDDAATRDEPRNLDFSVGPLGSPPESWRVANSPPRSPHDVSVAHDDTYGRVVCVSRRGSPWCWGSGGIVQQFSAVGFRSAKIAVRAQARLEAGGIGSDAWLYLVGNDGTPQGFPMMPAAPVLFAARGGKEIGGEWTELVLEAHVPEEAETLTLSFVFSGDGEARLGPLTFERVG